MLLRRAAAENSPANFQPARRHVCDGGDRRIRECSMPEQTHALARAGDYDAFRELTDPYRRELQLHIYRIVGSAQEAEDMLQDTLWPLARPLRVRGPRVGAGLAVPDRHQPLAGCPAGEPAPPVPAGDPVPEPTRWSEPLWLEPYPDVLLDGIPDQAPGRRRATRPRRRSRWRSSSASSISRRSSARCSCCATCWATAPLRSPRCSRRGGVGNSLLRRARAAFESRLPATGRERAAPDSALERELVGRFAETVENGDIEGMVALLTDDAWLTMPPLPHAYQGATIGAFLRGAEERRGAPMRLVPTRANTQPAFGSYLRSRDRTSPVRSRSSC